MPQPTPYVRSTDFTEYATAHPEETFPPAALDDELDDVETTLEETLENLELLQRDDGALRNEIVTPDSLSPETRLLIGTDINPRGDWATATAYAFNDYVTRSGSSYLCAVGHTSGDFDIDYAADKWMLLATDATGVIGDAEGARDAAYLWANEDEDVLVDDGEHTPAYSAYHWAQKASEAVGVTAAGVDFTPAGSIAATDVQAAIEELATEKAAASHAHAQSDVTSLVSDLAGKASTASVALKADLASPALTGVPTAPTAAQGTNTTQIATTAFVQTEIAADAPTKTGTGASGTWSINISGNAATATNATNYPAHTHAQSDVTNLTTDLAAKSGANKNFDFELVYNPGSSVLTPIAIMSNWGVGVYTVIVGGSLRFSFVTNGGTTGDTIDLDAHDIETTASGDSVESTAAGITQIYKMRKTA